VIRFTPLHIVAFSLAWVAEISPEFQDCAVGISRRPPARRLMVNSSDSGEFARRTTGPEVLRMIALPPNLRREDGDQVSGLGCPDCHGVLQVRVLGSRGHLQFTCRIGHNYGLSDLLLAKENDLEERAWGSVVLAEEIAGLLGDLLRDGMVDEGTASQFAARQQAVQRLAATFRAAIEADRPVRVHDEETAGHDS
jgi:hypothetical protein